MSEEISLSNVNSNYLDKVMDLSEEMNVEAIEDIFDSRGMKLVSKGTKISRNLQEKLILHKLRKPLELSISVEGGVSNFSIHTEAEALIEKISPLTYMCKSVSHIGSSPLKILKQVKFGNAMSMMLTITDRGGKEALSHSVAVSLISICIAKKLGLSDDDQTTVALAGLLHDIGELYISPEYLKQRKRRLLPHEWRHVVVHPRVGQMLIEELEYCPSAVSRAVAEHHERFDGGGYPRHLSGNSISVPGQILSVAEISAGVFTRSDRPLERAELALKILPGEHSIELVSAISSVLRLSQQDANRPASSQIEEQALVNVQDLFNNINDVLTMTNRFLTASNVTSKAGKDLLARALQQSHAVKRSFSSTGLDLYLEDANISPNDHDIQFEVNVASKEIQWRMRDIARNLALQSTNLLPDEMQALKPLIQLLDEGTVT